MRYKNLLVYKKLRPGKSCWGGGDVALKAIVSVCGHIERERFRCVSCIVMYCATHGPVTYRTLHHIVPPHSHRVSTIAAAVQQ